MYHGSDKKGLKVLDPNMGIYHPEDWAGAEESGVKIEPKVVWVTPDWEAAVAFALKGFVEDLVVDPHTQTIYLQSSKPIGNEAVGYVYTIDPSTKLEQINPWEQFSRHPVHIVECKPVTLNDFKIFKPVVVAELPKLEP